jgi:hypothetical protein
MCACVLKEDKSVHIAAGDHTLFSESDDKKGNCAERAAGYNPTAVYIPANHNPAAADLNVILWMHGYYVTDHKNIFSPPKGYDPKLRENVAAACADSGKDVVLVAPYLGHRWMVEGADHKLHGTGDTMGLKLGVQPYLEQVLPQIAQELYPGVTLTIKNLILAGHSAGGGLIQDATKTMSDKFLEKLKEVWGFDCMYQDYGCWADGLRPPDGIDFFFYLGDGSNATRFKNLWTFAYGTPKQPDPQPMFNMHMAAATKLFRAPPPKGSRKPPPPEGIALEALSDSETFQSLDDIQQKDQKGLNLTPYEKYRLRVDPMLNDDDGAFEEAVKPLMTHFEVVQKVLKPRIANMLSIKHLASIKGLKQLRTCPATDAKPKGKHK